MRRILLFFSSLLVLGCPQGLHCQTAESRSSLPLLLQIESARRALERAGDDSSRSASERADIALRLGRFDEAASLWDGLRREDPEKADAVMAEIYLQKYQFKAAGKIIEQNLTRSPHSEDFLWLYSRLLLFQENLSEMDRLSARLLNEKPDFIPALLMRGSLHYRLLNYDSSTVYYGRAREKATTDLWKSRAVIGLSEVDYERQQAQNAVDTLLAVLNEQTISDRLLFALCRPLIRLGRVQEATRILAEILELNPYFEAAHYYLGNGFTRFNYTQLEQEYPQILADSTGRAALTAAKHLLQTGNADEAEAELRRISNEHPGWIEPLVILGSMAWTQADFETARAYFEQALQLCPYWGRAHNGYAKAVEGKRLLENIHRTEDWQAFEAEPMPEIPRLGEFVIHWNSLSPRHQKQVALAILPWKVFVPVLVESGFTYNIKPLYERLSDCPGLETIRDLRISYDSRLWDDVRGCGGFHTVTGIEDVERTIYRGHNTVLHELTHQVHTLVTPDEQNRIQEAYRNAKTREENGIKTFLSQYQATSVEEYFAEGVNAYWTPRRDDYDTREIVRERLFAMDTALVRLVESFMTVQNVESYYVIGLVNSAGDRLEKAQPDEALAMSQKAYARDPNALSVLKMLSHVHSIRGEHNLAVAFAETLRTLHPDRSQSYVQLAEAVFQQTGDKERICKLLADGIAQVIHEEAYRLQLALGGALWQAGNYEEAARYYSKVLDDQRDNSDALWGMGIALGDGGKIDEAKRYFEQALKERTGIIELRLDYARILLQSGDTLSTRRQLTESQLLDPEGEDVLTIAGWLEMAAGRWPQALEQFEKALEKAPYNDLARILKLKTLKALKRDAEAKVLADELWAASRNDKPQWIYHSRSANYIPVHEWPAWQVRLLETVNK
ncbi:MAG: tetratricopeptide repeat protein [Calditrichaeota bacterium]|nr:tetratricopeptide repeat protein [Calditrichota bacterium]